MMRTAIALKIVADIAEAWGYKPTGLEILLAASRIQNDANAEEEHHTGCLCCQCRNKSLSDRANVIPLNRGSRER